MVLHEAQSAGPQGRIRKEAHVKTQMATTRIFLLLAKEKTYYAVSDLTGPT